MTARPGLHVESRPWPGAVQPEPDPAASRHGLAVARAALGSAEPCPPTCAICHSGWTVEDHAIGPCAVCGEPCRSRDPDGLMRHPQDCETRESE
jgi:hypothetical protein